LDFSNGGWPASILQANEHWFAINLDIFPLSFGMEFVMYTEFDKIDYFFSWSFFFFLKNPLSAPKIKIVDDGSLASYCNPPALKIS